MAPNDPHQDLPLEFPAQRDVMSPSFSIQSYASQMDIHSKAHINVFIDADILSITHICVIAELQLNSDRALGRIMMTDETTQGFQQSNFPPLLTVRFVHLAFFSRIKLNAIGTIFPFLQ